MENNFSNSSQREMETINATSSKVKTYILNKFAEKFNTDPNNLDLNENLLDLGLDSSVIVQIAEEFENELSIKLYPTVFFEYKTLNEIIGYFSQEFKSNILQYVSPEERNGKSLQKDTIQNAPETSDLKGKITHFMTSRIAPALQMHAQQIDLEQNLLELGLGSSELVSLADELEKEVKITLYPTVFFEYQNLASVVDYFVLEFSKEFAAFFTKQHKESSISQTTIHRVLERDEPNNSFPPVHLDKPDNLHAYTLDWEKSSNLPEENSVDPIYIQFENDSSSIKKHVLKKAFSSLQVFDLEQNHTDFTSIDSEKTRLILFVNEKNCSFDNGKTFVGIVNSVYKNIQTILKDFSKGRNKQLCQINIVVESDTPSTSPLLFAFRSLLKSISLELPFVQSRVLGIGSFNSENSNWIKKQVLSTGETTAIKADEDIFVLKTLREQLILKERISPKNASAYIITGGSGKLGQTFAKYLATGYNNTVVLLGRRSELPDINNLLESNNIVYRSCDVTDQRKVQETVDEITASFGPIRGVIHAAGVIEDGPFLTKSEDQFKKVAETKIVGLINLDIIMRTQPLDFLIGFSSVSSFMGNRSQTDYALSNGFMDGFLRKRNVESKNSPQQTKYISINWPLWEKGGMMPPKIVLEIMSKNFGIDLLADNDGLLAFESILSGNASQVCVLKGQSEKFEKILGTISDSKTPDFINELFTVEKKTDFINPVHRTNINITEKKETKTQSYSNQTIPSEHKSSISNLNKGIENKPVKNEDIAIVGMDGTFPKSPDISTFWSNLEKEIDMVSLTPQERLESWKPVMEYLNAGSEENYFLSGGYIDDVDKFDAEFFNISAREAEVLDPQQRLFLESAWKCLQDAGYDYKTLSGSKTGVFAAVSTRDYHELLILNGTEIEPQLSTGLAHSILPNRVSYWMNFTGPSETVDTACSSSLVAIHRAIAAIRSGECTQALVGGVNLIISPLANLAFSKTGILGKDGRCKTFDKDANGYARGEGVGTIFLKPYQKAIEDGDNIYGLIKGSSVNHGGRGKSLTAPNPALQAEVIASSIIRSGCDINTINYIEAHGTGTALGDPVEIDGLKRAFVSAAKDQNSSILTKNYCGIGAVKSNIGHLEAAAGIAGVLKVLLALKYQKLPASLHIHEVNPYINLENSPFYLVRKTTDWPKISEDIPRRAGISSFGFGGANAHIILEEYSSGILEPTFFSEEYIFPFSAPSYEQLHSYLKKMSKTLQDFNNSHLEKIAYTLQTGRGTYPYRSIFIASSIENLILQIQNSLLEDISDQFSENISKAKQLEKNIQHGGIVEHLLQKKDFSNLADLWIKGIDINWKKLYHTPVSKMSLPTFPLKKIRYWISENPAKQRANNTPSSKPQTDEKHFKNSSSFTSQEIKDYLIQEISVLLKKESGNIDCSASFLDFGLDSILGMSLVKKIEQKLNIPVYVKELLQHDSIDKLSSYLENETKNNSIPIAEDIPNTNQNFNFPSQSVELKLEKPIVFLLSTPRAGSTLLRAMLMGHSKLFAPPELHLLNFENLKSRNALIGNSGLGEGLEETIKVLTNKSAIEAKEYLKQLENQNTDTKKIYSIIQELVGDQILIDKSPGYASDLKVLKSAESQFSNAKYIHLLRHPFAVMESIVRNRFHKFIPNHQDINPYKSAENIWHTFNDNITQFLTDIPSENSITVYYEDLIADPQNVLSGIADFLNLRIENSMLNPYQGDRLIKGLHDTSMSIGDPNFLKHSKIEKDFAHAWKSKTSGFPELNPNTINLANNYGYDVYQNLQLSPQQNAFINKSEDTNWLLEHRFTFSLPDQNEISELDVNNAAKELINSYPILSRVLDKENKLFKYISEKDRILKTYFEDLQNSIEPAVLSIDRIAETVETELDIRTGPVLFLGIFKTENNYTGLLIYHHLLGDGMSSMHMIKNIVSTLKGSTSKLPKIRDSYIYYLNKIRKADISGLNINKMQFNLPLEFNNGSNDFNSMKEESKELMISNFGNNVQSIFINQGSALALALSEWTKDSNIVFDVRYHGRMVTGVSDSFMEAVGYFAYDIPVQIKLDGNAIDNFREAYSQAKNTLNTNAEKLTPQVRFNFQPFENYFNERQEVTILKTKEIYSENHERSHLLDCIVRYGKEKVSYIIRYSENHFSENSMEKLLDSWIKMVTEENRSIVNKLLKS